VTLVVGLVNVVLALVLARAFGWGLYGLAIAGGISLTLRRFVFTPLYVAAVLHQPWLTYYRCVVPILGATLGTIGLCQVVLGYWPVSDWMDLGLAASAVSVIFLIATWLLLSAGERAALKEMVVRWRE
jgi:membrane protein EpsK